MPRKIDNSGWSKALAKRLKGAWLSFIHPEGFPAAGKCEAVKVLPHSQPGSIPDFALTLKGRTGRVIEVRLVESKAFLHSSEAEAFEAVKNGHPIEPSHYTK